MGSYLFSRISSLKNVFILKAAAVKEIKQGKVITDKGDFGYKYLVGADGSLSAVRKFLKRSEGSKRASISHAMLAKVTTS